MGNLFSHKSDSSLQHAAASAGPILAQHVAVYGVDSDVAAALTSRAAAFGNGITSAKTAADAAKQATALKESERAGVLAMLAQVSAVVYGPNSTVTDADLAAIGFAPRRSGSSRPVAAQPVLSLAAAPSASGSVALSWDRSGNSRTAIFQIEASLDAGATWTMVGSTSRTKTTLEGFAPGVAAWFRITATTATTAARPSFPAAIYAPQPNAAVQLRVA